ncbi:DNA-formamidopyrimidine glycosylase [Candidatus Giovannonibacteria bacterium RIFCSPLOWO2_01_FULL_43_160]|uniref:Formamidopyrimidine-DNA glycosylase n=2 Tax=Candidatus Giovannoniibacteriota TaxID=1752738 RepID=A0A0G1IVL8_9BACT|nr:MAG: Formamidopyrimidine-DNA glycosylase [Candidatus Giovannonibacteria bacterium GW2011_GWB1_43_13]KKS99212.1 MAG: Formamidopyrimidine-DNA glycosylase [Candidatus Giovannonibacteria bacterium GW2011_GWA1_43_15]KKT63013.1 MAG: Formamidopyrimidine-DNA glycosylase [Candidatus Giovannonibacteria bacterium GW2011_GWA2_44_26]OGF58471.1 MAG: DNA-formamidopyrimidine glycosylase [Candidatus Giovannonibacteria bacterium RIFCSPHIGHO2_01_FULL_43_140]OGF69908.1 MAG: DNA-formamidopyrimidine glycosylase [
MPELPEVETTVRKLRKLILGKRILPARQQGRDFGGRKILKIERRGKAILIWLSGGKILGFHQRMTGKLLIVPRGFKDRHIRRRFELSSGKDLIFHDVRKFGVVWYGPAKNVLGDNYFKSLGLDALLVSSAEFKRLFGTKRVKIKPLLLNQKNLAGVGNIMADEILWHAKIHPERNITTLRYIEVKKLYKSTKFILNKSIKMGGSTMRDWLHPGGEKGGYFEKRFIYGREGQKCFRCGAKILRKKIASRSSYFCPKCQISLVN